MSRAATSEAQNQLGLANNAASTAQSNASNLYGQLVPQAQSLINSQGYSPQALSAITNAGMGGVNSAFGSAGGQINRNAARTKNTAGVAGQLDALAQAKGQAGGQEAGDIQIQNANFQNQQRQQGLQLLSSLYGSNVQQGENYLGQGTSNIDVQNTASPGWAQTLDQTLSAITGSGSGGGKCWIAAELYGGWDSSEVRILRRLIFDTWYMAPVALLYVLVGEWWAKYIQTHSIARSHTKRVFDFLLRRADGN